MRCKSDRMTKYQICRSSLSDRMDEWISRQHTLLVVAQESRLQSDQHKVVENDADVTDYPINLYSLVLK